MMDFFSITSHKGFDILKLRGDIKVGVLPRLSPVLSGQTAEHPLQHLVLDLSEVAFVDTSIAKLFANIRKRLESNRKKLYLLHALPKVAAVFESAGLRESIADIKDLERAVNDDTYQTFLPSTTEEHDLRRLHCICPACGSKNVAGYLLDENAYTWGWREDDFFPSCSDRAGEKFDFFSALPIACLDCYMVSTDLNHFTVTDANGAVTHHTVLSENAKNLLAKGITKRKKIIESSKGAAGGNSFLYPRDNPTSYTLYLLADSSIRTLALNKNDANPFLVGFLNYTTIRYADREQKDELVDNCRTWLTQAFKEKKMRSHSERAQAYFILFASALSLLRVKEANGFMQEFEAMMRDLSFSKTGLTTINSPLFWFNQAQTMWRREIEKKSSALAKGVVP